MHLYNFGTPLSIVAPVRDGKLKLFRPPGSMQNRFSNPKTKPKTAKALKFGLKQSIYIAHSQCIYERLRVV